MLPIRQRNVATRRGVFGNIRLHACHSVQQKRFVHSDGCMVDKTHDPALTSWVESANKPAADFPIQNLPFGSFRQRGEEQVRLGVAIGDMVLDCGELARIPSMAALMALPRATRANLRGRLSEFLSKYSPGSERF